MDKPSTLEAAPTLASSVPPSPVEEPVPVEFDGYRLLRSLGEGGMGEVWLATAR